jgi:hypothetical protein
MREFDFRRKILQVYLHQILRIWHRLPAFFRLSSPGQAVGKHVHGLVRPCDERRQSFVTFFLRNRAELELLRRLLERKASGSSLDITVLGCSKGAEVYSFLWTIRLSMDNSLGTSGLETPHARSLNFPGKEWHAKWAGNRSWI